MKGGVVLKGGIIYFAIINILRMCLVHLNYFYQSSLFFQGRA